VKLTLYFIGRPKDAALNAAAEEFLKRSRRWMECEMREIDPRKFDLPARHAAARKVMLDPAGKPMDSEDFSDLLRSAKLDARDLVFLIGGHDGLPPAWKPKADLLLSLSPMTMSHELARAVLAEQIYRGLTMLHGHPYSR
jgi:23S rRNA (pseudouridine1915-N3)-methyltransferase